MSSAADKKRKRPTGAPRKVVSKQKRLKRAAAYHSSSDDEADDDVDSGVPIASAKLDVAGSSDSEDVDGDDGIQLGNFGVLQDLASTGIPDADAEEPQLTDEDDKGEGESISEDSASDPDSDEESTTATNRKKPKRADPQAFATSIDKILNSKLTTQKRADPVLSRSKAAQQTARDQADSKLEQAARRKMRADKNLQREQGRERDVMGLQSVVVSTGQVLEEERRLKRLAQRGVVKLFNAVRVAQANAHEAENGLKREGVVGVDRRKERVDEMSKKGFLDLLNGTTDG